MKKRKNNISFTKAIAYYKKLLNKRGREMSWKPIKSWSHSDYEELQFLIYKETGEKISSSSLKRIFGKLKYKGTPYNSKLNILAKFIGYSSWKTFIEENKEKINSEKEKFNYKTLKKTSIVLFIILIISSIIYLSYLFISHKRKIDPADVSFSIPDKEINFPGQLNIHYDLSKCKPNINAYIVFHGMGSNNPDTMSLSGKRYYYNTIKYRVHYPGKYYPTLYINKQKIKKDSFICETDKWMFAISQSGHRSPLNIQPYDSITRYGYLKFNKKLFINNNLNPLEHRSHYIYVNRKLKNISFSHFRFQTKLKRNNSIINESTAHYSITLYFDHGYISFPITKKSNVSSAFLFIGDQKHYGRFGELDALGQDLNNWHDVMLKKAGQNIYIKIDNKDKLEKKYPDNLGNMVGIKFHGLLIIDYVKIYNDRGTLVYKEEFE